MKMYHWPSCEVNAQCGNGDIIVVASTEEDARDKGWQEGKKYIEKYYGYNDSMKKKKLDLLKEDLQEKPKVESVIFIDGSS